MRTKGCVDVLDLLVCLWMTAQVSAPARAVAWEADLEMASEYYVLDAAIGADGSVLLAGTRMQDGRYRSILASFSEATRDTAWFRERQSALGDLAAARILEVAPGTLLVYHDIIDRSSAQDRLVGFIVSAYSTAGSHLWGHEYGVASGVRVWRPLPLQVNSLGDVMCVQSDPLDFTPTVLFLSTDGVLLDTASHPEVCNLSHFVYGDSARCRVGYSAVASTDTGALIVANCTVSLSSTVHIQPPPSPCAAPGYGWFAAVLGMDATGEVTTIRTLYDSIPCNPPDCAELPCGAYHWRGFRGDALAAAQDGGYAVAGLLRRDSPSDRLRAHGGAFLMEYAACGTLVQVTQLSSDTSAAVLCLSAHEARKGWTAVVSEPSNGLTLLRIEAPDRVQIHKLDTSSASVAHVRVSEQGDVLVVYAYPNRVRVVVHEGLLPVAGPRSRGRLREPDAVVRYRNGSLHVTPGTFAGAVLLNAYSPAGRLLSRGTLTAASGQCLRVGGACGVVLVSVCSRTCPRTLHVEYVVRVE